MFTDKHFSVVQRHEWAGDEATQLYLQMHGSLQDSLKRGMKTETRRVWSNQWARAHQLAFENKRLVAVLGQGHASTIGFIIYTGFLKTTVGTVLRQEDLRREGCPHMTDAQFRQKWYRDKVTKLPLDDNVDVHVLAFDFYSLS